MDRRLLDIDELCERYGFRKWTIRSYCSQRKIPFLRVGRRVFFRPEDIERWLQAQAKPILEVSLP
jgi:excisionase family DNA binding protein